MNRATPVAPVVPCHSNTLQLRAAWGAARFATWKGFIKYSDNSSKNYSPEAIVRIDRIFEHHDINTLIEDRLALLKAGNNLKASPIRADLLTAGVEFMDQRAVVSGSITTRWGLVP
ncbi:MAG: hypothetical protein NWT00_05465 [Beijerinckiaceae bacterium]|jgi:cysteinyl-tRNA synthetase|nr:hypothetical protein [Beijerinckiaceae bacterium]